MLRGAVAYLADALMEAQVEERCGAGWRADAVALEAASSCRERAWHTRVGTVELAIPKLRQGSYFPSFLEAAAALRAGVVSVVQEAYVNGVSTRKVDQLVEALGLAGISKDAVSRLCRAWMSTCRPSASARWRAATPICGWTPAWRRSRRAVASSGRRW